MFQAWALITVRQKAAAAVTEVDRLRKKFGAKATSLWTMNRDELLEVARTELGMTKGKTDLENVITLREKIRRVRKLTSAKTDPLAQTPKGLTSMSSTALQAEIESRGLPAMDKQTRPAMIVQIKDDVAARSLLSERETPSESSKALDDDWDMAEDPTKKRR